MSPEFELLEALPRLVEARYNAGVSTQIELSDTRHLAEVGSLRGWRTTDAQTEQGAAGEQGAQAEQDPDAA